DGVIAHVALAVGKVGEVHGTQGVDLPLALNVRLEELPILRLGADAEMGGQAGGGIFGLVDTLGDASGVLVRHVGTKGREQDRERDEALLAVNDLGLGTNAFYEDDAAEEVRREVRDRIVTVAEEVQQIIEELTGMLGGPSIRPLVGRHGEYK